MLPYCKVAKNEDAYHMRFVRVKAQVQFRHGDMFIHEDCDPVEALESWVQIDDAARLDELLRSDPFQEKTAYAIVEGEFDAKHSLGCYGPKFRIIASKIKLISPLQDVVAQPRTE